MGRRICVLLLLAFSAWGSLRSLGRSDPPKPNLPSVPEGVQFTTDLVYGHAGDFPLVLDLAQPKAEGGLRPAVVFVHGGGWTSGTRREYHAAMLNMARLGFVTLTVDYRLAPKYPFPAALEDVKCAVRWLRAHAAEYRVDPDRIGAVGLSAGAHLVSLLATTPDKHEWDGNGGNADQPSGIRAMVGHAGPYDLLLCYTNSDKQNKQEAEAVRFALEALLGGSPEKQAEHYREASPTTHASQQSPAALIMHGSADPLVPMEQAELFHKALQQAGADSELLIMEGGIHGDLGREPDKVIAQVVAFLQKHLADQKAGQK